jgi:peptide/nickel transport system permease protein
MSVATWLHSEAPTSATQASLGHLWRSLRLISTSPLAVAGLLIVLALILLAILAPWLSPWNPVAPDLANRLLPPSGEHWLGTDGMGRDAFARIAYGSRITLTIVILVSVIAGPIGLGIGIAAGYLGKTVDGMLMRITDIFMAFPRLLLALAVAAALGPGLENAIIAIAITSWPPYARLARSETLAVRDADYIAAVRLKGASTARLLLHHIAPLCLSSLVVRLTFDMAGVILIAAGLGFLGLGAQPPTPEWGTMVAAGRDALTDQWWVSTIPGAAIFIVSLGFNLLGDGLRDILDPRSR